MSDNRTTPQQHRARGIELRNLGRRDEAIAEFSRAVEIDPSYAPGYFNIATTLLEAGRATEAVEAFAQAIQVKPDYYHAYAALGTGLRRLGRLDASIEACRAAIRIKPDFVEAHLNLATALHAAQRMTEAVAEFEQGLRLDPANFQALNNYANLLADINQTGPAVQMLRRAIQLQPARAELFNNLGNLLKLQANIDEAIACYEKVLSLQPNWSHVHSNLLLTLNCHPRSDASLLPEHLDWARRHADNLAPTDQKFPNDRSPERRLRIGYISADFRRHAVSYFFEPLLDGQDREQFEIYCYSDVIRSDDVTTRLRRRTDQWRQITGLGDDRVAEMIREDRIDILVDLAGHTGHNRLLVFARRPAPVQVSYLGYPNTTGLRAIDYRLTDSLADPPGITEANHVEKLIRLEGGFLCYRPDENAPPVAPRAAGEGRAITFGTFNNFAKVTAEMVRIWSQILREIPESRLLIKADSLADPQTRAMTHSRFASHDISDDRLILLGREPSFRKHLETYGRIDIALDTFPYHGTTTTCEAMWMGVPVVTLAGKVHVSRVGVSLLHSVGLEELIASTPEQYISIAVSLAKDPVRLEAISGDALRKRMIDSRLTDAAAFSRTLAAAYRGMWRTWCG